MGTLTINPIWDQSVLNMGTVGTGPTANTTANYQAAANQAIANFTSAFSTIGNLNVTINIDFSFGVFPAIASTATPQVADPVYGPGASFSPYVGNYTFSQFQSIMAAAYTQPGATQIQQTALNVIGTTAPAGNNYFTMNVSQLKVLGQLNQTSISQGGIFTQPMVNGITIDGYSALGNLTAANGTAQTWAWSTASVVSSGGLDAVSTDEHEIAEVLGRIAYGGIQSAGFRQYSLLDFFEYTASAAPPAGTDAPATGFAGITAVARNVPNTQIPFPNPPIAAGAPIYFSPNGTSIYLPFRLPTDSSSADIADWGSSAPTSDSFGAGPAGVVGTISASDKVLEQVLGLVVACFASGTRIATPEGPVAVEDLTPGMTVLTAQGDTAPVIWMGHRRVDCARHPDPKNVLPVRVQRDAFGPGRPHRDLVLSPDHAVAFEDVLIPIRHLVNGSTIRQESVPTVTYWHVELPEHDLLLAEGLEVESYLDTGDRDSFANGGVVVQRHPSFGAGRREANGVAPLVVLGAQVDRARDHLAARASVIRPRAAATVRSRRRASAKG